jgi:hypothetical protein
MKKGIIVDGKNLTQWARELGVSRQRIQQRYHRYGNVYGYGTIGRPPKSVTIVSQLTGKVVERFCKYDTITYLGKSVREWGSVYDANYKRIIYAMNKSQKRKNPDIFHNLLKA